MFGRWCNLFRRLACQPICTDLIIEPVKAACVPTYRALSNRGVACLCGFRSYLRRPVGQGVACLCGLHSYLQRRNG